MLTTQEFLDKIAVHAKAENRLGIPVAIWMFGWMIALLFIAPYADKYPWLMLSLPIWLGGGVVFIALMVRAGNREAKELGLVCPSCKKSLANAKAMVLAGKHCCFCGVRVLAEVSDESEM